MGEENWIYSEKFPGVSPPEDSFDFRLGGARKRHSIYELAVKWNAVHTVPKFRVSVVDAWSLTDNFPESTSDGRHWVSEGRKYWDQRSLQGEAEGISPRFFISLTCQIVSRT